MFAKVTVLGDALLKAPVRRAASVLLWALGSSAAIAAGAQERAPASGDAPALAAAAEAQSEDVPAGPSEPTKDVFDVVRACATSRPRRRPGPTTTRSG